VVEEPVVIEPVDIEESVAVEEQVAVEEPVAVEVPVVDEPTDPKVEAPFNSSVSVETIMNDMVDTAIAAAEDKTVDVEPLVTPEVEEATPAEKPVKKVLQAAHEETIPETSEPVVDTDKELCAEANRAWDTIHNICLEVCRIPMTKYTFDADKKRCFLKSVSEQVVVKETKPKK